MLSDAFVQTNHVIVKLQMPKNGVNKTGHWGPIDIGVFFDDQ